MVVLLLWQWPTKKERNTSQFEWISCQLWRFHHLFSTGPPETLCPRKYVGKGREMRESNILSITCFCCGLKVLRVIQNKLRRMSFSCGGIKAKKFKYFPPDWHNTVEDGKIHSLKKVFFSSFFCLLLSMNPLKRMPFQWKLHFNRYQHFRVSLYISCDTLTK